MANTSSLHLTALLAQLSRQRNLNIWLEDNGTSLDSFCRWIHARLNSDNWQIADELFAPNDFSWLDQIDSLTDWAMLDNLHAIG